MATDFCGDTAIMWKLLGYVVLIIKVVIPLILIILGMVDLGKSVVSDDEKAIGKSVGALIRRFIAALAMFFVPTIISAIFNFLDIMNENQWNDFNKCIQCVTNVSGDVCTKITEGKTL